MTKKVSKTWIFLIVLVLLIGGFVALKKYNDSKPGLYDDFVSCLNDNGVKMYGAFWCPVCKQQQEEFGRSWKNVNYVECSKSNRQQTKLCFDEKIESYPTWEFNDGEKISGLLSLFDLSERTGCALPD